MEFDVNDVRTKLLGFIASRDKSRCEGCAAEPVIVYRGGDGLESEGNCFSATAQKSLSNRAASREIQEAVRALQKLDEGTYGYCDECEEEIPASRMKNTLHATHCITCKSAIEKDEKLRGTSQVKNHGPRTYVAFS